MTKGVAAVGLENGPFDVALFLNCIVPVNAQQAWLRGPSRRSTLAYPLIKST